MLKFAQSVVTCTGTGIKSRCNISNSMLPTRCRLCRRASLPQMDVAEACSKEMVSVPTFCNSPFSVMEDAMYVFSEHSRATAISAGLIFNSYSVFLFPMPFYYETGARTEAAHRPMVGNFFKPLTFHAFSATLAVDLQRALSNWNIEVTHARINPLTRLGTRCVQMKESVLSVLELIAPTVTHLEYMPVIVSPDRPLSFQKDSLESLNHTVLPNLEKLFIRARLLQYDTRDTCVFIDLQPANVPKLSFIAFCDDGTLTQDTKYASAKNASVTYRLPSLVPNNDFTMRLPLKTKALSVFHPHRLTGETQWIQDVTAAYDYWRNVVT